MDRDTVVKLAREAGIAMSIDGGDTYFIDQKYERFATLVRNAALEEAAKVCEEGGDGEYPCCYGVAIDSADDIRALKE